MSRSAATGFDVLRHRVAQLDRCVPGEIYAPLDEYRDPDAVWFARVLGRRTDMSGTVDENGRPAWSQIEPDEADAIVAGCGLIERMRAAVPHVVDGPVDLTAQLWVHDQSAHGPAGSEVPSEEFFVPVDAGTIRDAATKPWDVGFFTSTAAWAGWSMWRVYQETRSSEYPGPLSCWGMRVEPGTAVNDIRSAADWVWFVARYPLVVADRVYPDWPAVAREWHAVRFTGSAIAAGQGLVFPLGDAWIQPFGLDVEQTFWLSWRFTGALWQDSTTSPAGDEGHDQPELSALIARAAEVAARPHDVRQRGVSVSG